MSKILTRWPADAADRLLAANRLFARDSENDEEEDDDRDENEEEDIDDEEGGYSE